MSELLLELFSEEIPARMQARAADDLRRLVVEGLKSQGLEVGEAKSYSTPRRLTLVVEGVPAKSPGVSEERRGPRVGAPEQAVAGFLKAAGLASLKDAEIVKDEKKGDYYVARIDKPGRKAGEIVAEVVPAVLAKFPWPKSMRWGSSPFQWVRPLHSILCLLDGKIVKFEAAGVTSGKTTRGHRFHGNEPFPVESFADYVKQLKKHKVMLDPAERAASISEQAHALAKEAKLTLVEDEALLAENAGLTEWPVVFMGEFDKAFLAVPGECLTTSMKQHQKCFSLKDPKSKKLANKFLAVSNLTPKDKGVAITEGNEKVIRARLSDAKFFWDQDLKRRLEPMHFDLKGITFHEKLGTQWDRMERITELARQIAGAVDAEPDLAGRAAQLCKADLVSGMVGEFPELQGLMGRYYAEAEHMNPKIAAAIEEHYKPKGQSDSVPTAPVSIAVALADKLDTLVGFWDILEKPTGSGDPYQLRRAALGVIRIALENDLRISISEVVKKWFDYRFSYVAAWNVPVYAVFGRRDLPEGHPTPRHHSKFGYYVNVVGSLAGIRHLPEAPEFLIWGAEDSLEEFLDNHLGTLVSDANFDAVTRHADPGATQQDLLSFFADRLKVYLRDKGARHDLIDAVFSLGGQDDLALIVKRVEALTEFLKTDDGANLLAGVKRASNILSIEEKKDKKTYDGEPDGALLAEPAEKALATAITKVKFDTKAAIDVENFAGAMRALAELRAPVDKFFEHVTVNVTGGPDVAKLRENRLKLLSEIRAATLSVADFSRIAG